MYNLTTLPFLWNSLNIINLFLIFTSITLSSQSLQSKIPALYMYLTTPIAHAFITLIKFPPYHLYLTISWPLLKYSCLTFSFLSFCIISAPSNTQVLLPILVILTHHLSIQHNSSLHNERSLPASAPTQHTYPAQMPSLCPIRNTRNIDQTLQLLLTWGLAYSFTSSINNKWLINLWSFPSLYPMFSLFSNMGRCIIARTK